MSNPIFDDPNPSEGMEVISPNNGIRYVFQDGAWRVANVSAKDIVRMDDVSDAGVEGLVEDDKWFWWDEERLELKIWQNNAWLPVNFQDHNADVVVQDYDDTELRTLINNNANAIDDEEIRATDSEAYLQEQIDALGGGDGKTYLESLASVLAAGRAEFVKVVTPDEWGALSSKPLDTLFIVLDTTLARGRWYLGPYPLSSDINIELPPPPPSPIKLRFTADVGEWEGPLDTDKIEVVFVVENISTQDSCSLEITYPDGTMIDAGVLDKGDKYVFSLSTTDDAVDTISGTYIADGHHPNPEGADDKEQVSVIIPDKPVRPKVDIVSSVSVDPWIDNTDPDFTLANPDAFQTTIYFNLENLSEEDDVTVTETGNSGLTWEVTNPNRALDGIVKQGEKRSVKATFSSDDRDPAPVIEGNAKPNGVGEPELIEFSHTVVLPNLPGEMPDIPTTEDAVRHVVVTDASFDPSDANNAKGIAPIRIANATDIKVIEHPTLGAGYYEVSWAGDFSNENGQAGVPNLVHVVQIGTSEKRGVVGVVDVDEKGYLFANSKIGSIAHETAIANDIVHSFGTSEYATRRYNYLKGWFMGCTEFNDKLNWTWDYDWWMAYSGHAINMESMFKGATKYNQPMPWLVTASSGFPGARWPYANYMFENATAFDQDISNANAYGFTNTPYNFDSNASNWMDFNPDGSARCNRGRPQWGYDGATCVFDRDTNPETYEEEEYTILVASSDISETNLKNQFKSLRYKTYSSEVQDDGSYLIKGVWDWHVFPGANYIGSYVTDVLQFGFDAAVTPKPLISATEAFSGMQKITQITALEQQTVDFVGEPRRMFYNCRAFNQNLDKHDWDIWGNCTEMFMNTDEFNNGYAANEKHVMGFAPAGKLISAPSFGKSFNGELLGWDFSTIENVEDILNDSYLYTNKITSWFRPEDHPGGVRWTAFGRFNDAEKAQEFWNSNNGFVEWQNNPQWIPMDKMDNSVNYLAKTVDKGYKDGWFNNAERPDFSDWTVYRQANADGTSGYFNDPDSFYDHKEVPDAEAPDKSGRPVDDPRWGEPQYGVEPSWPTQTFDEAAWHIVLRTDQVVWPDEEYMESYDDDFDADDTFMIPFDTENTIVNYHLKDVHSIASDPNYEGQQNFDFATALEHLTSFNDIPNGFTIEPITDGGKYDGYFLLKAVFSWDASNSWSMYPIVDILQVGTTPFAHLDGEQDEYRSYVLPSKYEATERAFVSMSSAFNSMDFVDINDTGFTAPDEHMYSLNGRYDRVFSYAENFNASWFMNWKRPPLPTLLDATFSQMFYGTDFNQDIRDWWVFQGMVQRNAKNNSFVNEMFSGAEKFNMGNAPGALNVWDWKYAFQVMVFARMFENCKSMNIDISSWYMNEAIKLDYMFKNCSMMNADLSKWNTCSLPYGGKPPSVDTGCNAWEIANKPLYGECRH